MAHRHRSGADEALTPGLQPQALDGTADGIGAIQHPHRLAMFGRCFEDVAQGGDERIDTATQILQVDENDVEGVHHRVGRPAHLSIQTEDRDAMHRIVVVRRLDHVVLLVAAKAMLRTEGGGEFDVTARGQSVKGMPQVVGDRGRVRKQGDTPTLKRRA